LAVGDAVGTTLEFKPRGTFTPINDMVGGGPFGLPVGAWTDDTSLALCLATSFVEKQAFDAADQMHRYCNWWQHGYLSSTGDCFDIGNTTIAALSGFLRTGDAYAGSTHPQAAGNGSIMRLAPVPMFYSGDERKVVHFSAESSRTTHGAAECVDACAFYGSMIDRALRGQSKDAILDGGDFRPKTPKITAIANGEYKSKPIGQIRGSGYVVESLEAALWCFYTTETYRDAVLKAANLGDDTDTTAAVVGQVAGAYYGLSGIPSTWVEKLVMRSEIEALAVALWEA
ncbi:MAG: ADP-ribosylglycohydrolase family protein, partial [Candidatus Promineifilaceae bacterium]